MIYRQEHDRERKRPRRRPGRGPELGSDSPRLPLGDHPKPAPRPSAPQGEGLADSYGARDVNRRPSDILAAASNERGGDELERQLSEVRERLARIGAWILDHDLDHEAMARGLAAYQAKAEEIRALERGPLAYLSRPGDEWIGPPVIFPGDDPTLALPAGKWERLPDGRILAKGLTLFDLRAMKELRQIAREAIANEQR